MERWKEGKKERRKEAGKLERKKDKKMNERMKEQGRIHGNTVADGWAGAVMQKPLAIQKCDGRMDVPTDRPTDTAKCRVACPRLKTPRKTESSSIQHSILRITI